MNARTAKLLRRFSTATACSYRKKKRFWLRLPAPQRHTFRQIAQHAILDASAECD